MSDTLIQPGTLWESILDRSEAAIAAGKLHTIATRRTRIEDGGMRFSIRIAENLRRKAEETAGRETRERADPFLPPEAELTAGDISASHRAVLNKFNVVEHHLLIVTREFEEQEQVLNRADFEALWMAMREYPALGFYNGGTIAGASQRHKHLQAVPLSAFEGAPALPVDPLLESSPAEPSIASGLPFRHCAARLDPEQFRSPSRAALVTYGLYREMLEQLGLPPLTREGTEFQSGPYNLLMTREWLMVVPRRCEHWDAISINALGFAGSLFVQNQAELEKIREAGPMTLLKSAAG
ncbi:ATP adenylyltransferase family protein [Thiohalomonas denitrificans]|uniref:ATP adenylyltransferase n=1 Tax=Thiohalomonas denitrificans TaxID=415747 RepID=A0A1G5QQV5_9GAMM|nr:DUF4922 domain-containing protein [Thiohalomonas denitrificans]SCZ64213.1 ATP adenylyltransferase [Thiohalomonas denitrificans]